MLTFMGSSRDSGVIHQRDGGTCPPKISCRGGQSCKSPPTILTHNNAIAGFTSQSLGLLAYACKTDSSTAIKLAPWMHQNWPFWAQKSKKIWGGDIATSPDLPTSSGGEGDTSCSPWFAPPPLFKLWICPCHVTHNPHVLRSWPDSDQP